MSSILLAFPGEKTSQKIRSILLRNGFSDVRIVSGGKEALREMRDGTSGILVCPVRMRDMDYTEALANLPPFYEILLLDSPRNIAGRKEEDVMALTSPVRIADLLSTADLMISGADYAFRREKKKRQKERQPKKRSPEEQKILDDAKAYLMERNNLSEPEAFRYIQKNSMDTGRSMIETAKMILTF